MKKTYWIPLLLELTIACLGIIILNYIFNLEKKGLLVWLVVSLLIFIEYYILCDLHCLIKYLKKKSENKNQDNHTKIL